MEQRLIDANALIKDLHLMAKFQDPYKCSTILGVCSTIEARKTIDAVPVVHGRWILVSKGNFSPGGLEIEEKCSECGRYVYRYEGQPQDNYCPNCGAKMDGGAEG